MSKYDQSPEERALALEALEAQGSRSTEKQFKPGDLVTYRAGKYPVLAIVARLSKTGKRIRIRYKPRPGAMLDHFMYVSPQSLELGHV